MEFFSGTVSHQLDGKNRIRIPAKFRAKLGKPYYFMARPDGCIGVYSKEALGQTLEKMQSVTTGNPQRLTALRKVAKTIEEANEDDQGRVLLSQALREHAQIAKDVVTVGMFGYLEVWSKEKFDEIDSQMTFDEASRILDY